MPGCHVCRWSSSASDCAHVETPRARVTSGLEFPSWVLSYLAAPNEFIQKPLCVFTLAVQGHYFKLNLNEPQIPLWTSIRVLCSKFDRHCGKLPRLSTSSWDASAGVLCTVYLLLVKSVIDYFAQILLLASITAFDELVVSHHCRPTVWFVSGLNRNSTNIACSIMALIELL